VDKKTTTFGLSPEKLARFLSIGSELSESEKQLDQDQKKADLLRDKLAEALPLDQSALKSLPASLVHLCENLGVFSSEPIGNLLRNPKSEISVIKMIKDYSKDLSKSAKSEAEHDTAITIYYAAIANALIFRGLRITKFSFESLNSSFCSLSDKPWVATKLGSLFKQASEVCQSKLIQKSAFESKKRTSKGHKK